MVKFILSERKKKELERLQERFGKRKLKQAWPKIRMIEFFTYMKQFPDTSAAAAARHFSNKWGVKLNERTAQRWNKMSRKEKELLVANMESGLVGTEQCRFRPRKTRVPMIEEKLKERVDARIKSKLPRPKEWVREQALDIAKEEGKEDFIASNTYIARFMVRNIMCMKMKTSNRSTDLYQFVDEQYEWLIEFRNDYGNIAPLLTPEGEINDELFDSMDEFPIILDHEGHKQIDYQNEKTSQLLKFQSTFDLTKVFFFILALFFFLSLHCFFFGYKFLFVVKKRVCLLVLLRYSELRQVL